MMCCLSRCVTFNLIVIWILIEAVIVLGFAISTLVAKTIVSAPMLSLGLSFMLVVWPLLKKHLELIAHHLTEKEFYARLETMNKLQVDDLLVESMNCKQKCKNLTRFFFCQKIPDSQVL